MCPPCRAVVGRCRAVPGTPPWTGARCRPAPRTGTPVARSHCAGPRPKRPARSTGSGQISPEAGAARRPILQRSRPIPGWTATDSH
ncbi:hypothetical protein SCATT_56760 [Streptantibioticus cattleyicolor NRRL 8057 = DSM 46488]|uniref:Uncharacterized protein n=1 Tax=Streptantibioticus cattleyicolor (strain ATCC 35852 / DSM 46488 / JCM 4925 / NBRC 14057 / NRRL 8057) TaxID=1003195 RepID=G8X453_STREN|nr:hypothetical protein SCATT_56760 [Streptantibioticus cattleyicolor NRRL 8057 = DSM 46488]